MNEFLTWEILGSFVGASTVTALATQFIKNALSKIPTQILSYLISLVLLLLARAATGGGEDWTAWAITPFNAILVSLSSNGEFSAVKRIFKKE